METSSVVLVGFSWIEEIVSDKTLIFNYFALMSHLGKGLCPRELPDLPFL